MKHATMLTLLVSLPTACSAPNSGSAKEDDRWLYQASELSETARAANAPRDFSVLAKILDKSPQLLNKPYGLWSGTRLHKAVRGDDLRLALFLLERGADMSAPDARGDTPLHVCESAEMARILCEAGADVKAKNKQGHGVARVNPYLSVDRSRRIARVLTEAGAPEDLLTAVRYRSLDDIKRLLAKRPRLEDDALHHAVIRGDLAIVDVLLTAGANPNVWGSGQSANLIEFGVNALVTAVQNGQFAIAERLLAAGARITGNGWPERRGDNNHGTLLERAAADAPISFVRALLAKGSDPSKPPEKGWRKYNGDSALAHAAGRGRNDVVQLLLKHGTRIDVSTRGATPLMHAAAMGHSSTVDMLLRNGAKCTFMGAVMAGSVQDVRKHLASKTTKIEEVDARMGMSPLLWAVTLGHNDVVKLLLDAGADPDRASHSSVNIDAADSNFNAWEWERANGMARGVILRPVGRALSLGRIDLAMLFVRAGARPAKSEMRELAVIDGLAAENVLKYVFTKRRISIEAMMAGLSGVLSRKLSASKRRERFDKLLRWGADRYLKNKAARSAFANVDPSIASPFVGELRRRGWRGDLLTACRFGWLREIRRFANEAANDKFLVRRCIAAIIEQDRPNTLQILRECVGFTEPTNAELVHEAASGGARRIVLDFIARGLVRVDVPGLWGTSLLISAAESDNTALLEDLVRFGLDVNACPDGLTALHMACMNKRWKVVETLMRLGADVNAGIAGGKTALSIIFQDELDFDAIACVRSLLAAGAAPPSVSVIDCMESQARWPGPPKIAAELRAIAKLCLEKRKALRRMP